MKKRTLGVTQVTIAFLTLLSLIILISKNTSSVNIFTLFFDDAKIPLGIGSLIFLLMGVQNIYENSKFWQSKIVHIFIAVITLIVLYNSFNNTILLIIFLAMIFQQIQNMTKFTQDKTIGKIQAGALIIILLLAGIFIVSLAFSSITPKGIVDDKLLNFFYDEGGFLRIISGISFSVMLLLNSMFNLKSKQSKNI